MVLVAGLGGVSLFALGYIILAFWILWQGTSLYVMPDYQKTLKRWNLLLYYTVFVMFCKVALQVIVFGFHDIFPCSIRITWDFIDMILIIKI